MTTADNTELEQKKQIAQIVHNIQNRYYERITTTSEDAVGDPEGMKDIEAYAQAHTKAALLALREKAEEPVIYDSLTPVTIKVVRVTELDKALGADGDTE